jgi:hypothetical protein
MPISGSEVPVSVLVGCRGLDSAGEASLSNRWRLTSESSSRWANREEHLEVATEGYLHTLHELSKICHREVKLPQASGFERHDPIVSVDDW